MNEDEKNVFSLITEETAQDRFINLLENLENKQITLNYSKEQIKDNILLSVSDEDLKKFNELIEDLLLKEEKAFEANKKLNVKFVSENEQRIYKEYQDPFLEETEIIIETNKKVVFKKEFPNCIAYYDPSLLDEEKYVPTPMDLIMQKVLHRIDGPALEFKDGGVEWWVNGVRHNLNAPAIQKPDGTEEWWVNGYYHRVGAPARISPNGNSEYWVAGIRHNLKGPAITNKKDGDSYYIYGKKMSKKEFELYLELQKTVQENVFKTKEEMIEIIEELKQKEKINVVFKNQEPKGITPVGTVGKTI